ncbi:MAG: glucose-6-phosphate isomerase [Candidatus Nitricoxidivorans perseverans]|uniref:Glucose-6-phosphate isomerase n=1 Tax=Candidatus Nitricoxidivorans perseverans TaxID=2975601 RepID=A0AA49IWJ8_9PROT|nr:MAG: glucose-6-phosphate isomerase [Candidatus Nitricoxidivorans perseverans]
MTAPAVTSEPWEALAAHAGAMRGAHLRDLFESDPGRFARFSLGHDGLLLDYSKQRVTDETMAHLRALWRAVGGTAWVARMRAGEAINHTEGRAALHHALRHAFGPLKSQPVRLSGQDVMPLVRAVLDQMRRFCHAIHSGEWRGATGEPIRDIVNIGIGGSDLGPKMATQALAAHRHCHHGQPPHLPFLRVHYVSNVDGAHLATTLADLSPRTTLFVIASKTFTTQETMQNAHSARTWLTESLGKAAVARHFVAVSTNLAGVSHFGIDPENAFAFWDWVGGRFSLWSAIGLPLALAIGFPNFEHMLAGGAAMDAHFFDAPVERNLPLTLAFIDLWNLDFLGAGTRALLPYSQSLGLLPRYFQQLEMESNGKQAGRDGANIGCATAPVLWGEAGTDGQHSFYQLIHQGGRLVPCDFIALREADFPLPGHHEMLLANCLAQSESLMRGKTLDEVRAEMRSARLPEVVVEKLAPYKTFPGNQPSTTLLLPRLDPYTLGQLIALFEHKVFALGVLWHINSFDQWGVEYGKQLANRLLPMIEGKAPAEGLDSSTSGLIRWITENE